MCNLQLSFFFLYVSLFQAPTAITDISVIHSVETEKDRSFPSPTPFTLLGLTNHNVLFPGTIAALVNDTVGTLLAHSYKHPNTFMGAIFGTGTNGAYVEATRSIKTMSVPTGKEMIINIEWGNFDKDKRFLPVTPFDNKLDRESIVSFLGVLEPCYLPIVCPVLSLCQLLANWFSFFNNLVILFFMTNRTQESTYLKR